RELLAASLGSAAEVDGDVGPFAAGGAQVGELAFLGREAFAEGGEQFAALDDLAGRWRLGRQIDGVEAGRTPVVAALRALTPGGIDDLVARHADQQADEVLRPAQVVLTQSRAQEEAAEDGLADVHRVEAPAQEGVAQEEADLAADFGFVTADEVGGGVL